MEHHDWKRAVATIRLHVSPRVRVQTSPRDHGASGERPLLNFWSRLSEHEVHRWTVFRESAWPVQPHRNQHSIWQPVVPEFQEFGRDYDGSRRDALRADSESLSCWCGNARLVNK